MEYFHSFVGAALVAPGQRQALPLAPEFVRPQDGPAKQDCESRAARRWLARLGPSVARLNPVYLGDDLYSRQPVCEAVRAAGGSFIFVCKPSSHKTLSEYTHGVVPDEVCQTVGKGKARRRHRYRWMNGVPLCDGADALHVNWLEIEIARADGSVTYRNSFVTDLAVTRRNVADIAASGRARWKVENETFNVLKTNGYNLEHNFGHGSQPPGAAQPARLRHPFGLRPRRGVLAAGAARTRSPKAPVRTSPHHHRLPRLRLMGDPHDNTRHRPPATERRLSPQCPQPSRTNP